MRVPADTCVWSLAPRRRGESSEPEITLHRELAKERRVEIIGTVRPEVLSSVRDELQFGRLRSRLDAFPGIPLESEDYHG